MASPLAARYSLVYLIESLIIHVLQIHSAQVLCASVFVCKLSDQ